MSRKAKPKKKKEEKFPIEKLGKTMGYNDVYIKSIKRMKKFPNGYKITQSELQKLKRKYYGGD